VDVIVAHFVSISQTVAEIWRLKFLEMAVLRHLAFYKFRFLTVARLQRVHMRHVNLPNFVAIGPTIAEMWSFNGFQNDGRRPIGFVHIL